MLFGGGVVLSNATKIVAETIEKASIPSCHTIMGTGVLHYDNPLNLGMVGNARQRIFISRRTRS